MRCPGFKRCGIKGTSCRSSISAVGRAIWKKKREPMPRSDCICKPATEQLHLPFCDGQPEAGAALMLRVGTLMKGFENAVAFLFGNAQARINHLKCPQISGHIFAAEEDFTHVGKLDGVAQQVDQHLPRFPSSPVTYFLPPPSNTTRNPIRLPAHNG